MIKPISKMPGEILGFEAIGTVTARDHEKVIFPAIEKTRDAGQEIRMLYYLGKKLKKFDMGAIVDDTLLAIKYFRHWQKVAIVSDKIWVNRSMRVLGVLRPGHVRTYQNRDLKKAVSWLKN